MDISQGDLRDWPELPETSGLRALYRDAFADWSQEQILALLERIRADIDQSLDEMGGCC